MGRRWLPSCLLLAGACAGHPVLAPGAVAPGAGAPAPEPPNRPARVDAIRPAGPTRVAAADPILALAKGELDRSMAELAKGADAPYFAAYEITDARATRVTASSGVLQSSSDTHHRNVDIDVRAGDYKLDNTHRLREARRSGGTTVSAALPLTDDPYAVRSILWSRTTDAYKRAVEQLQKAQANAKVKVDEDDPSDDFSHEPAADDLEPAATLAVDRHAWEERLRTLSLPFKAHPEILTDGVSLSADAETRYYISSEGTRYQVPSVHYRLAVTATTRADDGMELHRFEAFDVASPAELPTDAQIRAKVDLVIADLLALRAAPVADPFSGPAILEGRAAGVFFHEVFGHRIEGHRQKDADEGQTFSKKVGQPIMPSFMNVYDDPGIAALDGVPLNGFYRFDDEGVAGARASLVENGVLRTFLLGRSPTRGFTRSNGHGRRQAGRSVVSRQGNLVVAPSRGVDHQTLRALLLAEVKKQGTPYGLVFRELDGGFTMTERFSAQAFKLLPIMVYRVYPDGREQLVRGADLEGTPMTALGNILAAGDDMDTFNGYCGAESGFVPVSASSPSLLVSHVELTKKQKAQDKPPILPPPPPAAPPADGAPR